jgi:hypothetical protein
MRVWRWVSLAFLFVGALLAWLVLRRRANPVQKILDTELRALEAERTVKDMEAREGADRAKAHVQAIYDRTKAELTEAQAHEAKTLLDDPKALANYLVRAGSARADRAVSWGQLSRM